MTDLINQIREDREKGTPGPWKWSWDDEPYMSWTLSPGVLIAEETDGTPAGDKIDQANARRIARVPDMEQTILDQAAEIERLREALQWYADKTNDCNRFGSDGDAARDALTKDTGDRARQALPPPPKEDV